MSDILNTYPVFERNQVLTSTQLNNLVNYLDQQNRLTRARLIGMGIVCGLEIDYNKSENTIMEAVWGLGEGIVSGKITPDKYEISNELKILNVKISDKKIVMTRDSSGKKVPFNVCK